LAVGGDQHIRIAPVASVAGTDGAGEMTDSAPEWRRSAPDAQGDWLYRRMPGAPLPAHTMWLERRVQSRVNMSARGKVGRPRVPGRIIMLKVEI
jgi:hypothetical protein